MQNPPRRVLESTPEVTGPITTSTIKRLVDAARENQVVVVDGQRVIPEIVSVSQNIAESGFSDGAEGTRMFEKMGPLTYRIRFIHADAFEWSDTP